MHTFLLLLFLNFDPCVYGWFYVSSLLSTLVTFAFSHTIGQFSPRSGKTFHACTHVGITVTTDNVLKDLESV